MKINSLIDAIKKEERRNEDFLHLTANEAQMSETARIFLASKLSERYYMGAGIHDGRIDEGFTALGFPGIHDLVSTAEEAAKEMLGAAVVNLSCLSGVHAMMCAILSTTEPGDTVMTLRHEDGGHFATEGILERVGRKHVWATFDTKNLRFDAEEIAKTFKESNAKAFYMDVSYYLNSHNLTEIRAALGPNAVIIYDASHTMGLIMGQQFQSPLKEGADVICANTHKTLPGPQKGMIAFRDAELGTKANAIIDGSLYSSPHTHHLIALAITILEMKEFGKEYALQIVNNSNAVGAAFEKKGYEVRKSNTGRYSENHQAHIFTNQMGGVTELYNKLYDNNITVNWDTPLGDAPYIRFGTQEVTRRGMKENEMNQIVELIDRAFKGENVKDEVKKLNDSFRKIEYSFDAQ